VSNETHQTIALRLLAAGGWRSWRRLTAVMQMP
jgi:hypothetical protein